MDEAELISRFRRGEERAFHELYALHASSLHAFLLRLLGPASGEAGDAHQDVWLRAARDLSRFRGDSRFRTWLFGIAVNRVREILRMLPPSGDVREDDTPPPPRAGAEERLDVSRALERLSPRYREVLVLHDLYEYTHAEVAALLGIDEGTSKSNLARARSRVRQLIGERP